MNEQPTPDHVVNSVAYDTSDKPYRGFSVRASYLEAPNDRNAWCEVFKDGAAYKSFYCPAYRIYNVVAHFNDMVDLEIHEAEAQS